MSAEDKKPKDESAEQAQSKASDNHPSEDIGDTPEVEAEIVADGHEAPNTEDLTGAHAGPDNIDANSAPVKSSRMTTGAILFAVFMVVVIAAIGLWRLQGGNDKAAETPKAEIEDAAPAQSAKAAEDEAPSPAEEKITNTIDEDAKAAAASLAANPSDSPNGQNALPPAPEGEIKPGGGDNLTLQREVKDAVAELQGSADEAGGDTLPPESAAEIVGDVIDENPVEEAADLFASDPLMETTAEEGVEATEAGAADAAAAGNIAIIDNPATDDMLAPATDIAPAAGEAPVSTTPDEPASAVSDATASPEAAIASAKILNEFEALKASLAAQTEQMNAAREAERQQFAEQTAAQEAQITALREQLDAALVVREDERGAEIADLTARLDAMQAQGAAAKTDAVAASLALGAVERAFIAGEPFVRELEALSGSAPVGLSLKPLEALAETGAPTLASLKSSFPEARRAALAAAGYEKASTGAGKLLARMKSLVSVSPATPQAGDSARAIISRADARLGENDLAAAAAELGNLDGAAAEAVAPWVTDVAGQLAASQTIDDLNQQYLSQLNQ